MSWQEAVGAGIGATVAGPLGAAGGVAIGSYFAQRSNSEQKSSEALYAQRMQGNDMFNAMLGVTNQNQGNS